MLSIIAGLARSRNLRVAVLCGFAAVLAVACDKVPLLAPQESTITLSSASTVVQANGTTQIHAIVIEPSGTPVHDGTTVLFTTNLGTLLPVEARTQNGVATVQFLGNGQSGKATIKALSGGSASDALELSVGAGASGRVSVTANPASVPAAGGTTTISAAVVDASGNPLFGVPVSFTTTAGTFSSAVVNSDVSGTARTTLTTNQAASVTATAGSTTSAPVSITVAAVPVRPTVSITRFGGTTPTEGGVTTLSVDGNVTCHRGLTDSGGDGGLRRRIVRRSRIDLGDDFHSTRVWGQRFVPAYRHRGGYGRNLRDGIDGHRRAAPAGQHFGQTRSPYHEVLPSRRTSVQPARRLPATRGRLTTTHR